MNPIIKEVIKDLSTTLGIFIVSLLIIIGTIYLFNTFKSPEVPPKPVRPSVELVSTPSILPYENVVTTLDSSGSKVNKRIQSVEGNNEAVVVVQDTTENNSKPLELIISKEPNTWFPDFKPKRFNVNSVDGTGYSVTTVHQTPSILDFTIRPTVGVATSFEVLYASAGVSFMRVGPVHVESFLLVEDNELDLGAGIGVDVAHNLMLGFGVNTNNDKLVSLKYHF